MLTPKAKVCEVLRKEKLVPRIET